MVMKVLRDLSVVKPTVVFRTTWIFREYIFYHKYLQDLIRRGHFLSPVCEQPYCALVQVSSYFKFFICIIERSWKNSFHPSNMHNQTCWVVKYLSWQKCKKEVTLIAFTFTSTSISICLCFFKKRDKATFKIFLTCQYLFKVS